MDVLQSWLLVGVPGVVLAAGLFVGRSQLRAWLGYATLLALVVFFVVVPADGISAAAIGLVAVVFVATGRGMNRDRDYAEHHENRKRYTTRAGSEA